MERVLGEAAQVSDLSVGELIWHDEAFRLIVQIAENTDGSYDVWTIEGEVINFPHGQYKVMRGWRFLVGRKVGHA